MYWNGLRVIDRKRGAAPNRSTEENDQYTLFFSIHPMQCYIAAWKILLITKVWTVKIIIENTVTGWCGVYLSSTDQTPSESIRNFRKCKVKISTNTKCRHARKGLFVWMKTYFHRRSNKPRVISLQLIKNWIKYSSNTIYTLMPNGISIIWLQNNIKKKKNDLIS